MSLSVTLYNIQLSLPLGDWRYPGNTAACLMIDDGLSSERIHFSFRELDMRQTFLDHSDLEPEIDDSSCGSFYPKFIVLQFCHIFRIGCETAGLHCNTRSIPSEGNQVSTCRSLDKQLCFLSLYRYCLCTQLQHSAKSKVVAGHTLI